MTDRELLELAAKAAKIEVYESTDGTIQNRPVWVFIAGGGAGTMPYEEQWNPLREDAQALPLAVRLKMDIRPSEEIQTIHIWSDVLDRWIEEFYGSTNDPYTATRRAIVRAAAEIGKGLE